MIFRLYFVVPKHLVQKIKQALDNRRLLDHGEKIQSKSNGLFQLPINLPDGDDCNIDKQARFTQALIMEDLRLCEPTDAVTYCIERAAPMKKSRSFRNCHDQVLAQALRDWVHGLDARLLRKVNVSADDLLACCSTVSAMYSPMLLLSKTSFSSDAWLRFIRDDICSAMQSLYELIASRLSVTHIAKLGPIPVEDSKMGLSHTVLNMLRSPTQFQPLYGSFGDYVPHPTNPTALPETLWVTVKQNGIHQCWAPLYTMFSQGNITEKTRLLSRLLEDQGVIVPAGSAAVDLYAGIGYFSFCYAKAGFNKVLCWELNPWSVEGLRRGAAKNKWRSRSLVNPDGSNSPEQEDVPVAGGDDTILVFHEDNVHAAERIHALRKDLPPIRHVNCGLLPSSEAVWKPSLAILDAQLGGWIHVHENIDDGERDRKIRAITDTFMSEAAPRRVGRVEPHKVKSYAPGTTHWVLDMEILPT